MLIPLGILAGVATLPPLTMEYLVIAGGGPGGGWANTSSQPFRGGGGGAGGFRTNVSGQTSGGGAAAEAALTLVRATNYTVTVGAGGSRTVAALGANSVFHTIT